MGVLTASPSPMIFQLPVVRERAEDLGTLTSVTVGGPVLDRHVGIKPATHTQALPVLGFLKPLSDQPSKYFPLLLPPPSPSSLFPALSGICKKSGERMIIAPRGTHLP